MNYNDLLIEILNMSPEQRKQQVRFATNTTWASDSYSDVNRIYCPSYSDDEVYLVED